MSISPRKKPTQARAQERVNRILDAAEQLLANDGYDKFSTNRVAQLAEVNIASLYQYFPNKAALLFAINRKLLDEVLELLENSEASWPQQAWTSLFDPLTSELLTSRKHVNLVRALEQAAVVSPELQQMEREHEETVAQFYSRFLKYYGSSWSDSDRLNAGRMIYAMCSIGLYDAEHLEESDRQRILQLFELNVRQFVVSILKEPAP
ncbi:MAG: hypothetical protein CL693_16025 [Cellvibrionaceae bacterium]|nr:hypothetical protein [Cellvibrionaceae bacterium]|tara:strand:- start:2037 stop:2657 length:621 start_codon:yes stop_codon:yes gene_type:complete